MPSVSQMFCKIFLPQTFFTQKKSFLPQNLMQQITGSSLKHAGIQDIPINGRSVLMEVLEKCNPKIIIFKGIMKFLTDFIILEH